MSRSMPRLARLAVAMLLVAACSPAPSSAPASAGTRGASGPPATAAAGGVPPLVDMPFYRMDAGRSAIQPGPGPRSAPTQAWLHPTSASHFLPILVGGLVVSGSK